MPRASSPAPSWPSSTGSSSVGAAAGSAWYDASRPASATTSSSATTTPCCPSSRRSSGPASGGTGRASWSGSTSDVDGLKKQLGDLADRWEDDYATNAGRWSDNQKQGFGPGYPSFDARTLYYTLRDLKPRRYLEVGSGLSTFYASRAAAANAADGSPLQVTCIEPFPYDALRTIDGIELVEDVVQNVALERFSELGDGDVLFIDSSHTFKIDSDVSFLLLEVLPRLAPGVVVHIHDVPFPFNTPYPSDFWLFGERWPVYWNEAAAVQTFLAFNDSFEVRLSTPLVRHHDEQFLIDRFPDYVPVAKDPNPPSSLWLRRTA